MLTDEEIMELTGLTKSMVKADCIMDISSQDLLADYRLIEAAVREKLKQQDHVGVIRHENDRVFYCLNKTRYTDSGVLPDGTKVYVAPMPDSDSGSDKSWKTIARENLEGMAKCREQVTQLEAERDELLAALQVILYHFVPERGNLKVEDDMIKMAHAAIAKAKGETK